MYRVLIVEDDPMVAMINEQYTKKSGDFDVVGIANSGRKALEILEKEAVDLIILDVFMPNMSGVELLGKIRENDVDADVIMVTAANDTNTLEATLRLGVVDYLVKPFAFERFKAALLRFVAQKEALCGVTVFNQQKVDSMLQKESKENEEELPKGIQKETMNRIMEFLNDNDKVSMTGEDIGIEIGLSGVTVRRYLNYLVGTGMVNGEMDYETGGRPCIKYSIKK